MKAHPRYGNLEAIAARNGGLCHLCVEPAPLDTYGLVSLYGGAAASVDHLVPQSWGGSDHPSNLRIAHQSCNSSRGTRNADLVRFEKTGLVDEPPSFAEIEEDERSSSAWMLLGGASVAGLSYMVAHGPSKPDQTPHERQRAVGRGLMAAGLSFLAFAGASLLLSR